MLYFILFGSQSPTVPTDCSCNLHVDRTSGTVPRPLGLGACGDTGRFRALTARARHAAQRAVTALLSRRTPDFLAYSLQLVS